MGDFTTEYTILEGFSDPVILVDGARQVVYANTAASEFMDIATIGRDLAISFRHPSALEAVDHVLENKVEQTTEINIAAPIPQIYQLQAKSVELPEGIGLGAVIVMRDVTFLKSSDQMRRDFIANVSHELRSPISSLIGIIETLRESAQADRATQKKFLQIMSEEASRMARLIDDLLSLSKVEVSEHVVPVESVSIRSILDTTIELLRERALEKGMTIKLVSTRSSLDVPGDSDELMEVFQNSIDNAIKYGDTESEIKIIVGKVKRIPDLKGPGLSISIENLGEGIAAEHIPRLTERFYRVDRGRSRKTGGTGLGLAIVKHIVNRHRGRLSIESFEGKTTTFTVFLPTPSS